MKIKDQILKLRDLGYSYLEIQKQLKCSKGTISYHCGKGQKDKTTNRRILNRNKKHPLYRKVEAFIYIEHNTDRKSKVLKNSIKIFQILYQKIITFSKVNKEYNYMSFTVENLLQKIGNNPVCALTGRPIDLMNSRSYQLDHIIPRSKGGSNTLDNCQIVCREANQAKSDLSLDEFVNLCRDVVNNFDKNL